ncbi:MAG: DUF167 domain-containing protein [Spirochaetes bacterium]|nr:DUF167 domain-containing protein [Spirochaetota bacterium]
MLKNDNNSCRLTVKVSPKSSKKELVMDKNGELKLFLNSPPVDGKANKECILFLSGLFHVPKTSISIVSGEKSKIKVFSFSSLKESEMERILKEVIK